MRIYIEGARKHDMAIYASFRMNDAHACDEARGWYGRSRQKTERPDLLLGSPVPAGVHGADWSFSWRWNYAKAEVRERFLGLFDETLTRYDFDGLELDFSRAPPFFRAGEIIENIPTLTQFMRDVQADCQTPQRVKRSEVTAYRPGSCWGWGKFGGGAGYGDLDTRGTC